MATERELREAVTLAAQLLPHSRFLVIGSQAILGSVGERDLPSRATLSVEFDMAVMGDTEDSAGAELLDVRYGELTDFHAQNGWYVQGVSVSTAKLPPGWVDRLVPVSVGESHHVSGYCLEPHDLCASKLARNEQKDRDYVYALVEAGIVDAHLVRARLDTVTVDYEFTAARKKVAIAWIKSLF